MSTATTYEHIVLSETGVPIVAGTHTKVVQLVSTQQAGQLSAEELRDQLPHLTMGQVYSALAYYWDHKTEVDAEISRRHETAERLRSEFGQPPFVDRLRRKGHLES